MGYPDRRQIGNFSETLSRFSACFPLPVTGHRNVFAGASGPARPQIHQNVTHFAHFAAKYPVLHPKLKTFLENALQMQELYDIIMKINILPCFCGNRTVARPKGSMAPHRQRGAPAGRQPHGKKPLPCKGKRTVKPNVKPSD